MTQQNGVSRDIFRGAEKIEIFGKLPSLLWSYIDIARNLVQDLKTKPTLDSPAMPQMRKMLEILDSAADHLENQKLKDRLNKQLNMLTTLNAGKLSGGFIDSFEAELSTLAELAGQRVDTSSSGLLDPASLELEMQKGERIKSGRSADLIVNVAILDDVKNYLTQEILSDGVSSVLIIDNAGTLIVNIGTKPSLDATSLAAVAAANYAATQQIARLIGEQDFVLLFYKGLNESFHFCRVGEEFIIVTVFENSLSLGLLRLKIAEAAAVLEKKLPKRQA
ncbi:MAG: roadblock/LC7 domain-containing protein [Desulfomonilaceae bacterium]